MNNPGSDFSQLSPANIILVGMPGAGKSTIGREISLLCQRPCFDTDEMLERQLGRSTGQLITQEGEAAFRQLEQQALAQALQGQGRIIASGGGAVLLAENRRLMLAHGRVYWLQRDLKLLPRQGRPLSDNLEAIYQVRAPLYQSLAAQIIANDSSIREAALRVLAAHCHN